jgi:hypothetical protein
MADRHYRFRFNWTDAKVQVPGQDPRKAIGITYHRPPSADVAPFAFPALYVSPFVQDPAGVAARICAILEEHWSDEE